MSVIDDINQAAADSKAAAAILQLFARSDAETQVDNGLPGGIPSLAKFLALNQAAFDALLAQLQQAITDATINIIRFKVEAWTIDGHTPQGLTYLPKANAFRVVYFDAFPRQDVDYVITPTPNGPNPATIRAADSVDTTDYRTGLIAYFY